MKYIGFKSIPQPLCVTTFAVVWIEIATVLQMKLRNWVTTFTVVWIEIGIGHDSGIHYYVTIYAVVWIEMSCLYQRKV